jgi:hypothetical protein
MSKLILTEQGSTPTTPSSGKMAIYAKADGKAYALNDAGVEYDLTLGGGGGGGEDFAATLALGNTTGGSDIIITSGDEIVGQSDTGTAGSLVLRGGTDPGPGPTDGGDIFLIPGTGITADDGKIVFKSPDELSQVVFTVTGPETLQIGATLPFVYDGMTGKLTIPGIIDPTAIVFEEADVPTTGSTEGAVFVSDGTGGLTAGHLYYVPPSDGTPVDISNPAAASADTLQAVYDAGRVVTLSSGLTPIEITGGIPVSSALLAFKKAGGDALGLIQHFANTRLRLVGSAGAAGIDGTGIELTGGTGGTGNQNGGSIYLHPGAKTGSGTDGLIVFNDPSGTNAVNSSVQAGPTYSAPVLRSPPSGGGSFGVTLGPVVNLLDVYSPAALPDNKNLPNNVSVLLYNPNGALGVGTRNIILPASPVAGQTVVVKDVAGISGAFPATISGSGGALIDGMASIPLNANWKSYTFVFNQNWFII